jgi:hypothetical protein
MDAGADVYAYPGANGYVHPRAYIDAGAADGHAGAADPHAGAADGDPRTADPHAGSHGRANSNAGAIPPGPRPGFRLRLFCRQRLPVVAP